MRAQRLIYAEEECGVITLSDVADPFSLCTEPFLPPRTCRTLTCTVVGGMWFSRGDVELVAEELNIPLQGFRWASLRIDFVFFWRAEYTFPFAACDFVWVW